LLSSANAASGSRPPREFSAVMIVWPSQVRIP
jgi:hypothetical protein